jgi:hypothetical protein
MRLFVGPGGGGQSLELPRASSRGGVNAKLACNLSENTASCQRNCPAENQCQRSGANSVPNSHWLRTERPRNCRRTPSLRYSGAVREANRSEFSTGGSKKRSPPKLLLKKSGAGQSDPAYRSPRSNIRAAHCHCQGQTQIVDLSLGGLAPSSREPIDRNFHSPVGLWIESASISDSGDLVACHDFGGYRENMEDIGAKKLSVDFSQDRDLVGIKAKVLAFLKDDVAELGTVTCVIREAGEAGSTVPLVYHLGLGQAEAEIVEASAGEIAASLAEYAKGKDGKLYSDATLEILHP